MQDPSSRSERPPALLTAVGAALVLFQAWAYIRWLLADIPLTRAATLIPVDLAKRVEDTERFICGGAIAWLIALCAICVRYRRMTLPVLLTLAWSSVYWQESLINARVHAFSYNAHFLSRGDWIPYLPLIGSNRPLLDQPLLMEAPVFFWMIPAVCLCAYGLLLLLSRWIKSPALVIFLDISSVIAFEAGFELSGINQHLLVWNRVPGTLALWPETSRQWPLPELLLGLIWSLPSLAWFYRNRAPFKWLDPAQARVGVASTTARVLALSALINLAFLAYNAVFMLIDLDTTADFPPYLARFAIRAAFAV